MDRDIRIYFLFIGLPAVVITLAGLFALIFGVSGIAAEMEHSEKSSQIERYERRIKDRMATKLKAYKKTGEADYVWKTGSIPWLTNVSVRVKYGLRTIDGGKTIGWARVDSDTVIGSDMPPFREEKSANLYVFAIGAVMVALLCLVLFTGGFMLFRATKRARCDLEAKDSFLDVISHELNTPLGSVVPLSSALASGRIKDPSRRQEAILTISRESARMARMIDELLTVVRLRNGKLVFARDCVDIREIATRSASLVCVRHPYCKIFVEEGDGIFAIADSDKIEQVLVNLIENACRYASEEPIIVSCKICSPKSACIEVADRGPGFSDEERKRIFDRFYRLTREAPESGLGLGLNIVSGFVAGMGGNVSVHPRKGGGSIFRVELPLSNALDIGGFDG
ncbi:MAG: hypothetical protein J6R18_07685 [Kiritimatiellae bacterium]|nr:hypothetical protein [Kiritimatiellia bacterium]